jgi:hypothetical protein
MDIRYVVTSPTQGSAGHICDTLCCARGQAENLIKLHKTELASDRTSCRSANANQMRLILHTAASWLLWRIQQAIPKTAALAKAEFCHPAPAAAQACCPRHGKRQAHPHRLRFGLSGCRSAARHRSPAQACAHIARAAVPPTPRAQPLNPKSPSNQTR